MVANKSYGAADLTGTLVRQCELYTDRQSYRAGDQVQIHASTVASRFSLQIVREPHSVLAYERADIAGAEHAVPAEAFATGCDWPISCTFDIPVDFSCGFYRVLGVADVDGVDAPGEHYFVVTPSAIEAAAADITVVCSTATWTAYNAFGGASSYRGSDEAAATPSGFTIPELENGSGQLSIHRPLDPGRLSVPGGSASAPRNLPNTITGVTAEAALADTRTQDFARKHGLNPFYCGIGWAMYEQPFSEWAESEGFSVVYLTQMDLHEAGLNPLSEETEMLSRVKCLCMVGHCEYWSWEMRDAVDRYIDAGGHVARFAGNFWWQIRIEGDLKEKQICYKYTAHDEDPAYHDSDPETRRRLTSVWEDLIVHRPGVKTFGLNGTRGTYASYSSFAPLHAGGFTCYQPGHWALAGTGLMYGDVIGRDSPIFGFECDGLRSDFPEDCGFMGVAPLELAS